MPPITKSLPRVRPVVDFNKCDAHGICTHVCVHDVFKISRISAEQFSQLSFMGKLKTIFSDNRKAFVVQPENCHNCGLCVKACAQQAIQLVSC